MTSTKATLIVPFRNKSARIAVVGLGFVGLPLAMVFAEAGFEVIGLDIDYFKISSLNNGGSYIQDVPAQSVDKMVKAGRLWASCDFSLLQTFYAVSVCVTTPLRKTGDPDLSFIVSACNRIAPYTHTGMVVVLESSTYPGTTRAIVLPRLAGTNSLDICKDIFIAFSPERVNPCRTDCPPRNMPKGYPVITRQPAPTNITRPHLRPLPALVNPPTRLPNLVGGRGE